MRPPPPRTRPPRGGGGGPIRPRPEAAPRGVHSGSAWVWTSVSTALARVSWTVSVWGTAWHCMGGPGSERGVIETGAGWVFPPAIGKDHAVDVRNPAPGEVLPTLESLTAEQTD